MRARSFFVAMCVLFASSVQGFASAASAVSDKYDEFLLKQKNVLALESFSPETEALMIAAYSDFKHALPGIRTLDKLATADLLLLFRAADEASFYTSGREPGFDMASIADALHARKAASDQHFEKTYLSLIAAREYESAKNWRIRHSVSRTQWQLQEPKFSSQRAGRPSELSISGGKIVQNEFSMPPGAYVIAVVHPRCHFSKYAMDQLGSNSDLMSLLRGRIKWIAPQQREPNPDVFTDWNASYPTNTITQVNSAKDWSFVPSWDTPTFHFFENGILRRTVVGWPRDGRMPEFAKGLEDIGLAPTRMR